MSGHIWGHNLDLMHSAILQIFYCSLPVDIRPQCTCTMTGKAAEEHHADVFISHASARQRDDTATDTCLSYFGVWKTKHQYEETSLMVQGQVKSLRLV